MLVAENEISQLIFCLSSKQDKEVLSKNFVLFEKIFLFSGNESPRYCSLVSALALELLVFFSSFPDTIKQPHQIFRYAFNKKFFIESDLSKAISLALKIFLEINFSSENEINFFCVLLFFIKDLMRSQKEKFLDVMLSDYNKNTTFLDALFLKISENNSGQGNQYLEILLEYIIDFFSDPQLDFKEKIFFIRLLREPIIGYKTKFGFLANYLVRHQNNDYHSLFFKAVSRLNNKEIVPDLFDALSIDVLKNNSFYELLFQNHGVLKELKKVITGFLDKVKSENCKKIELKIFFDSLEVFYLYKENDSSFHDLIIKKSRLMSADAIDNDKIGKLLFDDSVFFEKIKACLRSDDLGFLSFLISDDGLAENLFSSIIKEIGLYPMFLSRKKRAEEKIVLDLTTVLARKLTLLEAKDGIRSIFSNDKKRTSKILALRKAKELLSEISANTFAYDFKVDFLISELDILRNERLPQDYVMDRCSLVETYAVANGLIKIEKTKMSSIQFLNHLYASMVAFKGQRTLSAVHHINEFFNYLASDDCKQWDEATLSSDTRSLVDAVVLKIYDIPGLCVSVEADGSRKFIFDLNVSAPRKAFEAK